MADIGVSVEASGFEEIEKEAKRLFSARVVRELANVVYADMKEALEQHIREDVYPEYPKPKQYLRRKDDSGRGTSLLASVEDKNYTKQIDPYDYSTGQVVAGLSYEPTGEHKENWRWSDASGDELIGRIEKKDPKYNWEPKNGEIPKRPFWQNFVEEMIEGGRFARVVEAELKRRGIAEMTDHITDVVRDNADGNY